jgi:CRP-like cAMP-binding protein
MNTLESILARHPFVIGMEPKHVAVMAAGSEEVEFAPAQIIFREGDPANRLYLLLSGRVALESAAGRHEPVALQELQEGDALGWSWLFPPFAWHFQARALTPVRAIACNGGHLLVHSEENHDFGYELMRRVVQVVIRRMQAARTLSVCGLEVEKANAAASTMETNEEIPAL